jgi:uncharacterized RDD family membrane protein YckC
MLLEIRGVDAKVPAAVALFTPWVIDMLFALWDTRKRTIHDDVGGSIVVDKARGSSSRRSVMDSTKAQPTVTTATR